VPWAGRAGGCQGLQPAELAREITPKEPEQEAQTYHETLLAEGYPVEVASRLSGVFPEPTGEPEPTPEPPQPAPLPYRNGALCTCFRGWERDGRRVAGKLLTKWHRTR
jgi:hypothetical protein